VAFGEAAASLASAVCWLRASNVENSLSPCALYFGSFDVTGDGSAACFQPGYAPPGEARQREELLKGQGPQDGEQVIPDSVKDGLDFADLVDLAAPRAYAMVATTEDMFPFTGVQATHDEAAGFYSLFGAGDNLQFFTGPGGHGAIIPLMPKIVAFYRHWLLNDDSPAPTLANLKWPDFRVFWCTSTGQVATALSGKTIYQINQERALSVLPKRPPVSSTAQLEQLQSQLQKDIPELIGMNSQLQPPRGPTVVSTAQRDGYQIQTAVFHSQSGMQLPAFLAIPASDGPKPALLITSYKPLDSLIIPGSEFDRAAKSGSIVLLMSPLPWPKQTNEDKPTLGPLLPWSSRALIVGKTLVGMRVEDTLAAVQWLIDDEQVDPKQIDASADGPSAIVLLHAAALDTRIRGITVAHAFATYQSVVGTAEHKGISESVIPNVLEHYDLDDLMIAIAPRKIAVIDPVNADGSRLTQAEFNAQLARVYAADDALHLHDRLILSDTVTRQQ
jgi:hypothetical protein